MEESAKNLLKQVIISTINVKRAHSCCTERFENEFNKRDTAAESLIDNERAILLISISV